MSQVLAKFFLARDVYSTLRWMRSWIWRDQKETQKNYETENTHRGKKKNLTLLHLLLDAWRISLIIPFGSVFLFWFWISFSGVASCCHSFWRPRRSFRFKAERIGLSRGRALRKEKERAPHHKKQKWRKSRVNIDSDHRDWTGKYNDCEPHSLWWESDNKWPSNFVF